MSLIAKSPTDRFLEELVTTFYKEGYSYQGYLQEGVDWWVRERINELPFSPKDKVRALKLVADD